MRVHKARGAAYDLDRERQYNWWRPGRKGDPVRGAGPCKTLNAKELAELCQREGIELSPRATVQVTKHI